MSQTAPSNDVLSLFANQSEGMASVIPDHGERDQSYQWPADGEHTVQILDLISQADEKTNYGGKSSAIPGMTLQFKYKLVVTTKDAAGRDVQIHPVDGHDVFYGERFRFPQKNSDIASNPGYVKNVEITKARLAGFIEGLLNRKPSTNLAADLMAVKSLIKSSPQLLCLIKTRTTVDGKWTNHEEKMVKIVAK